MKHRDRSSAASFSWSDYSSSPSPEPAALPPAPTSWLPAQDMKLYGEIPLTSTSDIGLVRCKDCAKPVLRSCMLEHVGICALARKKQAEGLSKKRKASPENNNPHDPASGPPKKKLKVTAKVTKGRGKGPVDLEKQCGVINDKGLPCSRSLTCKTHSMGAKRSVQGRSRAYDELLLDWQRANNPNFVEPVKRESKAEKKEKREKEKLEKKKAAQEAAIAAGIDPKKAAASKKAAKKAAAAAAAPKVDEVKADLDGVDSEEELEALAVALNTARERGVIAAPLATPGGASSWFVQRRERTRVCRDLLANALGAGGGLGGAMANGSLRHPGRPMA